MAKKKLLPEPPSKEEIEKVEKAVIKRNKILVNNRCKVFGIGYDHHNDDCKDCVHDDGGEYQKACADLTNKRDNAVREEKLSKARYPTKTKTKEAVKMAKKKNKAVEEEVEEKKSKKKGKKGKKNKKVEKVEKVSKKKKDKKSKKSDGGKTNLRQMIRDLAEDGKKSKVIIKKVSAILSKEKGYDSEEAEAVATKKVNWLNNEEGLKIK